MAGLALWLVPAPAQVPIIKDIQTLLRDDHPTSPIFEPHVTLLSGLDPAKHGGGEVATIWERTLADVASWRKTREGGGGEMGSLDVKLQEVTTRGWFFQCILAALHKDTSLLDLNSRLRKTFDLDAVQPPFFPHLSLLYGDLDEKQANETIAKFQARNIFRPTSDGVAIGRPDDGDKASSVETLQMVNVELWDCSGKPEEWSKLHSLQL
ncbi:hypothetical protein V8E36_008660 [Tilletia maclaganii]